MEYYVETNSFAAPFMSDYGFQYVTADSPEDALEKAASTYRHPAGLYAAVCYSSSDAKNKGEKPLARWLSNHARATIGASSILSILPGKLEIDGVLTTIENPKQAGVPIWDIVGWLGQSLASTTELYAHHHPGFMSAARDAAGLRLSWKTFSGRDTTRRGLALLSLPLYPLRFGLRSAIRGSGDGGINMRFDPCPFIDAMYVKAEIPHYFGQVSYGKDSAGSGQGF